MPDTVKDNIAERSQLVNPPFPSGSQDTASISTIELFLGMLAHELRTQLSGMIQASRYAQDGKNKDFYLRAIHAISRNTLHILDNMLITVKIRAGKLDITTVNESFCFKTWIKPLIQPLEEMAAIQRQNICLTMNPSIEKTIITIDKIKLGQIIQNLLTNALKFSHTGTNIGVKCDLQYTELTIKVMNQGMGIPPNKIDSLFKPMSSLTTGLQAQG